MRLIDEDPELSPTSKKNAKEKLRLQMMMLKIDVVLA